MFYKASDKFNITKHCFLMFNNDTIQKMFAFTTQKIKFSTKDFFSKCDQIRRKLRTYSHLLERIFVENFILCAVFNSTNCCFRLEITINFISIY